ncbi:MAG: EFR1 family ferrodoxin [Candidatus Riflebacteria bacterium]|nr:EFR1 family ferrodoxin [Candidatus Riflebacteria bacterium]
MPKAQIHYFSATGNSRLAAEAIVEGLHKADWLVSLKDIRNTNIKEETENLAVSDIIGFVFPIYAFRAAIPMEQHILSLPPSPTPKPVFFIATYAGYLDRSFMRLRDFILPKNYIPIITTTLVCEDAWTVVRFPGWIYDKGRPCKADLEKLRDFATNEIPKAVQKNRESPEPAISWVPFNPITALAATFPIAVHKGTQFPIFVKKSLCTRCGICVRQCPTGRLKLTPYPTANGNCVGCYGCINSCPLDAINTWFTYGNVRFRGPALRNEKL